MDLVAQLAMNRMPPVARLMVERMGEMLEAYERRLSLTGNDQSDGEEQQQTTQPSMPALPPEQKLLLGAKEAAVVLSISVRSLWRGVSAGELPSPVKVGGRLTRWRREDLERFVQQADGGKR